MKKQKKKETSPQKKSRKRKKEIFISCDVGHYILLPVPTIPHLYCELKFSILDTQISITLMEKTIKKVINTFKKVRGVGETTTNPTLSTSPF